MQLGGVFRFQRACHAVLKKIRKCLRLVDCREEPETAPHLIVGHTSSLGEYSIGSPRVLLTDVVILPINLYGEDG